MSIRSVEEIFMMLEYKQKHLEDLVRNGNSFAEGKYSAFEDVRLMLAKVCTCDMGKLHELVRQAGYVMLLIVPWTLLSAIQ